MHDYDSRLEVWLTRHRPLCPDCRNRPVPLLACGRIWAPEWTAEVIPIDELRDPVEEEGQQLRREFEALKLKHEDLCRLAESLQAQLDSCVLELEGLRREAASRAGR